MGILSTLGSWVSSAADAVADYFSSGSSSNFGGSGSSHHSSTNTNVQVIEDKDGVRKAELENERVGLENERVGLMRDAQIRLMETQTQMTLAIEEAKARGFVASQQAMAAMLAELSRLGNESLAVMENGTHEQIRQVEGFYQELENDIRNNDFMEQKLPQLAAQLEKFAPDSPAAKLYQQAIDKEIASHFDFIARQAAQMGERRRLVVESVIRSKENMQSHIQDLSQRSVEMLAQQQQQSFALPNAHNAQTPALPDAGSAPALENHAEQ